MDFEPPFAGAASVNRNPRRARQRRTLFQCFQRIGLVLSDFLHNTPVSALRPQLCKHGAKIFHNLKKTQLFHQNMTKIKWTRNLIRNHWEYDHHTMMYLHCRPVEMRNGHQLISVQTPVGASHSPLVRAYNKCIRDACSTTAYNKCIRDACSTTAYNKCIRDASSTTVDRQLTLTNTTEKQHGSWPTGMEVFVEKMCTGCGQPLACAYNFSIGFFWSA